ncbi:MAG: transporter, family, tartrate transporter [Sphingomonas bacterium]|uniref:MFS transporter n=1 Tax=Sphingomonas bacterium TaxID=1895847 RepID=UPI00262B3905|nr:MFS transporter [Sphingomonas bacterium]MDB5709140.1 transporter, family, tartrate transporter [Sphingomonas bacterium]
MAEPLSGIARSAIAKASWRIIPLLGLGYLVAYMDRVNIGFASTRMNDDLHFSATIYGIGGGLFFLSYALFEVPSNLLLVRFGARRWIARIMVTWGLLAMAMVLVSVPWHFYVLRFLLGFAEAGFFPGVIYYMAHWFPLAHRGRAISRFYVTAPLTSVVMGAISGWLLGLDGQAGLHGWQWLFLVEGAPAVLMGAVILWLLPDAPATARWLSDEEKAWLTGELAADAARLGPPVPHKMLDALRDPLVLQLGAIGFLCISSFYALTLSAPRLLLAGTGLNISQVGYIVGIGGVTGAASMLIAGWMTDRARDRFPVLIMCTALLAIAYAMLGLAATPAIVIGAYLLFSTAWSPVTSSQVQLWADVLPIRKLAVGCAAINSMSQIGAAISPWLWGWAKDATGGYGLALGVMAVAMLLAVVLTIALRAKVRGTVVAVPLVVAA